MECGLEFRLEGEWGGVGERKKEGEKEKEREYRGRNGGRRMT